MPQGGNKLGLNQSHAKNASGAFSFHVLVILVIAISASILMFTCGSFYAMYIGSPRDKSGGGPLGRVAFEVCLFDGR